jgi:hypothetical protein
LPFFSVIPQSATDLKIVFEEFDPKQLMIESQNGEEVDFLNAIAYRVFEYDSIVREHTKAVHQITLSNTISTFKYFNQAKLKLIDPATELFRLRYRNYLREYSALEQLPEYFKEYLTKLLLNDDVDLENEHNAFWNSLFTTTQQGTLKSAHFSRWQWKLQQSRGADVFIPPVPYVSIKTPSLIDKALEMNLDARDFVKDGEVTTAFVIDVDLFNSKDAIEKITSHLDKAPTKLTLFKFVNPTKILANGFGQYAKKNFELFLRVIKSIKEEQPERIFGVMDGGGFGYALLGAGFDFFTDTVSNYPPYYIPKKGERKHRGMLNAETLSIERFEGVKNMHREHQVLMHDCKICRKYSGVENLEVVDRQVWSEDCRRHAPHMWNGFTREYTEAKATAQEKLFFDKIQNSDYAIIGTIIRKINN